MLLSKFRVMPLQSETEKITIKDIEKLQAFLSDKEFDELKQKLTIKK